MDEHLLFETIGQLYVENIQLRTLLQQMQATLGSKDREIAALKNQIGALDEDDSEGSNIS